jgi:hypothetical protein
LTGYRRRRNRRDGRLVPPCVPDLLLDLEDVEDVEDARQCRCMRVGSTSGILATWAKRDDTLIHKFIVSAEVEKNGCGTTHYQRLKLFRKDCHGSLTGTLEREHLWMMLACLYLHTSPCQVLFVTRVRKFAGVVNIFT